MKVWSNIVQRTYARLGMVCSIVPFRRPPAAIKPLCDAGFGAVKVFARRNVSTALARDTLTRARGSGALSQAGCPPARVDGMPARVDVLAQIGCLPALVDGVLAGTVKFGEIDVHSSKLSEHLFASRASGQKLQSWHTLDTLSSKWTHLPQCFRGAGVQDRRQFLWLDDRADEVDVQLEPLRLDGVGDSR